MADIDDTVLEPALKPHDDISAAAIVRLATVKSVLAGADDVARQQVLGQHRYQCARQDERPHEGEYHRFRHRYEQVARHAREVEHGHEYDADRQEREQSRNDDLLAAVQDLSL